MLGRSWIRIAAVAVVATGCIVPSSYIYSPHNASYWADGYPGATNPVPRENPKGRVDVTSFGIVEIQPERSAPLDVLHVRLAVANQRDAAAWTLVPGDQQVEIAGEGRSRPIYVNSDVASLPRIVIETGELRVIDFYYPLPTSIDDDDDLAAFDVHWQMKTRDRTVTARTRFRRDETEPPPGHIRVRYYAGWGPYWWFDPAHGNVAFTHHRPILVDRPGRVRVTRPPMWHHRTIHARRW